MSEPSYQELVYSFPPGIERAPSRHIYVLSDATAATCESVLHSALCQFPDVSVIEHKVPEVRSTDQLKEIVADAARLQGVVVFTFVSPSLIETIYSQSIYYAVPTIDVLGPVFKRVEDLLKLSPIGVPGLLRHVDDEYFKRVSAMDFAVKHDDGLGGATLHQADIVLLGLSRCSKTPISIYLSYRGIKAANIPLVLGQPVPAEVRTLPREKLMGLLVEPNRLLRLRRARFRGQAYVPPDYVDPPTVTREVRFAMELYHELGCPIIDVTSRSIEEAATDIMNLIRSQAIPLARDERS